MLTTCWLAVALLAQDDPAYFGSLRVTVTSAAGEAHFDYRFSGWQPREREDQTLLVETGACEVDARARVSLAATGRAQQKKLVLWQLEPKRVAGGAVRLVIARDGSLSGELPAIPVRASSQSGGIESRGAGFTPDHSSEGTGLFGPLRFGGGSADEAILSAATFGNVGRLQTAAPLAGSTPGARMVSEGQLRMSGRVRGSAGDQEPAEFLIEWQLAAAESLSGALASPSTGYLPAPGTTVAIGVRVDASRARDVEAVEILLEDVTRYHGVATNALNHARFVGTCGDCGRACAGACTVVEGGGASRSRVYRAVSPCPVDDYLDCYFTGADNPGARVLARLAPAPSLLSQTGDVIQLSGNGGEHYQALLRVADGAARASLRARVRVGGIWCDLASEFGEPHEVLVRREPAVAGDVQSESERESQQVEDRDELPEGLLRGDGLTAFEEARGFIESGEFVRTDPEVKDLFVLDATGRLDRELQLAAAVFAKAGLRIHRLLPTEMSREVVNANSPANESVGEQPVVIMLGPGATESDEGGSIVYVGPPTTSHHVVRVLEPSAREVVHQLAHQVGIPHHGEGMSVIAGEGGEKIVAVTGGETSGEEQCLMRMRHADLLCSGGRVLEPFAEHRDFYREYPSAAEPGTVEEELVLCRGSDGTGVNGGSQGAGNATYGACARRFFVKGNGQ